MRNYNRTKGSEFFKVTFIHLKELQVLGLLCLEFQMRRRWSKYS